MVDFLKKQGYLFICLGLLALLVVALFWALSIGTVKLPLVNIYNTVIELSLIHISEPTRPY